MGEFYKICVGGRWDVFKELGFIFREGMFGEIMDPTNNPLFNGERFLKCGSTFSITGFSSMWKKGKRCLYFT